MYIVTGGAGFIGSNLVASLAAAGAEVMVVDRLRQGLKWRNLAHHTIAGIVPPEHLDGFLARAPKLKGIFHLGAISATTETDGDLVARNNIALSQHLWDWCADHEVPFVYASSAATYGDGAQGFDDDMHPDALAKLRPLNLYGWSKLVFDRRVAQMLALGHKAPPQWAGLRFFNVYGPNEHHKGRMASVVAHKFAQIAKGEPATLFASNDPEYPDGGQMRDFVHVQDCVEVMTWLSANPAVSGLFNVGSGTARTFVDLVTAIYGALGRNADIRFVPMPEDLHDKYQNFTEARLDRLREAGFTRPATTLEAGVDDYVKNYLSQTADPYR